ncbi:GLE1-like protein-domain-containing protein [Pisolithus orientalis]|uniref:GLE1-like protein-domain-containing protein n=1 Tax=Pisolithus orientalis TaxID=936130 RepID=UPI002224C927|nr:GLE1-like protein-domain-containing protein [Pisolithus orientalis]KAI6004398.1 GLE1-like protein-domain-containing protein [Pisolithus orientalis]
MRYGLRSPSPSPVREKQTGRRSSAYGLPSDSDEETDSLSSESSVSTDDDSETDTGRLRPSASTIASPPSQHHKDAKFLADRRALEDTIAAIRLRTRHYDPYEEWERQTRTDALRTARHLRTTINATHASHLENTHRSALQSQQRAYSSQVTDVTRLLEAFRIKGRDEEVRLRQKWKEEDKARIERLEAVIRAEEAKARADAEAERRKREEAERRRREEEERKWREEEERRKADEERRRAVEEEERREREIKEAETRRKEKEAEETENRKLSGMASADEDWKYARETLKNLKAGPMKTVKGDKALKSQWGAIRRQITPKIGQLTQDQATVTKIVRQLIELVRPPTPHPQALYLAALSSLSKCILLQAETEVTAEKKSAFPLAAVTYTFPDVFYAKMVQRTGGWSVPVVVPAHDVDGRAWDDTERRKAMGYRRTGEGDGSGEGTWESSGDYGTRLAGIMRVYFLVLGMSASISPAGPVGRVQRIFQLPCFWVYFSRILGDPRLLETAVAAQILHAALDVAGLEARNIWGKQWIKLLQLLYVASTEGIGSVPGTNGKRMLGGQTPEGKSARVRVQLEIERIVQAL